MDTVKQIRSEIKAAENPEKGVFLQRFFKTGPGEYAEGDVFLGLTVPESRSIAKKYAKVVTVEDTVSLLQSDIHEERLIALLLMIVLYKKGIEQDKKRLYTLYLANTRYINNWDLVDLSAEYIVGDYLSTSSKKGNIAVLEKLAVSKDLWERRIAIMSTFAFIKAGSYEETFIIADILLHDEEDLIQKAVGWMLREVGKRISQDAEEAFLKTRYKAMPRTMLRYAIERFEEKKRKEYLLGEI